MEQWSTFLQDRWYILVIAVVVLFLVMKLVKTVVKWAIIVVVLIALAYYGSHYADKLGDLKASVGNAVTNEIKDQAIKAITGEALNAKYSKNADGSYTVSAKNIKLEAKPGSNDAKITFMSQTFTLPIDSTLQAFIDQAKKNG